MNEHHPNPTRPPRHEGISSVILAIGLCLIAAVGCGRPRVDGPAADADGARKLRVVLASSGGGGGSAGAEESTGTGWGTLGGRFVFTGTPPEATALVVDKDTAVCTAGGRKLFDQSLQVDPSTKGLAGVVVFARKVRRVKERAIPEKPLVFDQKHCEFLSPVFAVRVGQPVDVRNSDPIGHNTNISGTAFNQLIPAGDGTIFTPSRETGMPVSVTCNIHPWMKAYAVFREDGYVAVSGTDGSFEIPDLPAGEKVELQVWHARATGPNSALVLDNDDLGWSSKGRFEVTLTADEVTDLGSIEVPASAIGG